MEEVEQIKVLVSEELKKKNFMLYSFNFFKSKGNASLEIVIDRDEPINIDDITSISHEISDFLDKHDFTDTPYTLDISSLGVEKPIKLESLDKYVGKFINIHLSNPYKGINTFEGDLVECNDTELVIVYRVKTRVIKAVITRKDVDKARLAIKF